MNDEKIKATVTYAGHDDYQGEFSPKPRHGPFSFSLIPLPASYDMWSDGHPIRMKSQFPRALQQAWGGRARATRQPHGQTTAGYLIALTASSSRCNYQIDNIWQSIR